MFTKRKDLGASFPAARGTRLGRSRVGRSFLGRREFLAAVGGGWVSCGMLPAAGNRLEAQEPPRDATMFNRRTREAIGRGLAYLARRQNEDGSFGGGGYSRNVAVCGLCGMAFLAAGHMPGRGQYGSQVDQCVTLIVEASQDSGYICFPEAASRGPMYGHGFATLFLSEVYGMTRNRSVRDELVRAVRLIVDTQNSEGGWRYEPRRMNADLSVTVCQLMALRAARNAGVYVPNDTVERSVDYVKRCQNADGGFMYRLTHPDESLFPRSAAAVVALYSAGIYDSEEVRRALDYLMKFPPQQNSFGEQNYYFYGHYYAVQVMWQAGGEYWRAWYPAIRDVLLTQQEDDGSWFDTISPEYGTAMAVLILQMPGNYLPILQR